MRRRCPAVAGFLVAFLMARASVAAPRTGGVGGAATRAHARLGAGTVARARRREANAWRCYVRKFRNCFSASRRHFRSRACRE